MPFHIKSGGTWRQATGVHVKAGGAWRPGKELWVKSGGVWRLAWTARTISVSIVGSSVESDYSPWNPKNRDVITFGVSASDGATPSSYQWEGSVYGTDATATFYGPWYSPGGFSSQGNGYAEVTVVISGTPYTAGLPFSYTFGDEI